MTCRYFSGSFTVVSRSSAQTSIVARRLHAGPSVVGVAVVCRLYVGPAAVAGDSPSEPRQHKANVNRNRPAEY